MSTVAECAVAGSDGLIIGPGARPYHVPPGVFGYYPVPVNRGVASNPLAN